MSRMENSGTNNKKTKGKRKKVVIRAKSMFRNVAGIMMAQLDKRPAVTAKEGIMRHFQKAISA